MINANTPLHTENIESVVTSDKKINQVLDIDYQKSSLEHLQKISVTLDKIEKNLSFQSHILYIDTVFIFAILALYVMYSTLKRFI
jgi:hypothetical protein